MNDYDDSEDYSSANSFRARSNTWPLNRPDLAVPSGVCIDETLPEIELEDDDLFTTNENWSTGLVDHDIMSWDPILNAQNQQQQQQHQQTDSSHLHQLQTQQHHHQQPPSQQSYQSTAAATIHHHHHQQPPHEGQHQRQPPPQQQVHHQQQQHLSQAHPHQPQHHHQHLHQPQQQQDLQNHEGLIGGPTIVCRSQASEQQRAQGIQPPNQHNQTLNCSHYLDSDDPNDYHIQQLHHLHLDNNQAPSDYQSQYVSTSISPMCVPGQTNLASESYNISSDHQSINLQPIPSGRYDLDGQCEPGQNNLAGHPIDQQHHQHHQIHQHHSHPHQLHNLTSTSLDNHSGASHMLSSSLSTSGICLSGDLEDLDYKPVDPSSLLQGSQYGHDRLQDQSHKTSSQHLAGGSDEGGNNSTKQSSSTTSSKTKLNTPRRNAWGNMSYADLISQAINSTNDKRLTLSQIYEWMVQHVPYFKDKGDSNSSAGWKNSVRHNLSLHNRFKRLQNEGTGKSSWWTINPEANIGKCARRRAASMEASKFEKKRGRAKKRAEAVRQGLLAYPSLTNSSLNGSTSTLEQQLQPQISHPQQPQSTMTQLGSQSQQARLVDQFEAQRPPQQKQQLQNQQSQQPLQSQTISQYDSDKQHQPQQLQIQQHNHQQPPQQQTQQPPQNEGSTDNSQNRQPNTGLYVAPTLKTQYELDPRYTIVMSK